MNKLKNIILITTLICLSLFIVSCSKKNTPAKSIETTISEKTEEQYIKEKYVKATVIDMSELAGCNYILQLETGGRLEPDQLSELFKKDKTNVWVQYTINKNSVSVCMVGQRVVIHDIQLRK